MHGESIKHRRYPPSLVLSAVLLAGLCVNVFYSQNTVSASVNLPRYIDEFEIPTPNSAPLAITVDKNGFVWFTESNASKLARFDPATNTFQEYPVPEPGDMWGITLDAGGHVWFTQYSGRGPVSPGGAIVPGGRGRLGRFDPINHNFTFVEIPGLGSFPMRLVTDGQNRVWFTEFLGNKIAVYDQPQDRLTEYNVPTNASGPADLTFDRDGVLWFTEAYGRKLGRFSVENRSFLEFSFDSTNPSRVLSSPVGVAAAQSGNLWIADHGGNWIVEFNPRSQQMIRYPTHTPPEDVYPLSIPNGLLIDDKGRIWFSEHGGNSIGYFDPEVASMVEFPIPTGPLSTALWIALAPNGKIWFTEWSYNKIGVVHTNLPVPLSLRVSERSLSVRAGEQTFLSLLTKVSKEIGGNGTFRYSWASYNPSQIEVAFSPQYPTLAGLADTPAQVQLQVSGKTTPGNYSLGLGIDVGTVLVWTIIQTQVIRPEPTAPSPSLSPTLIVILLAGPVIALTVIFFRIRSRKTSSGLTRSLF